MKLYLDLNKADDSPKTGRRLNTGKLVKKPVQVRGKNGATFTRMQWTDPSMDVPENKTRHHNVDHVVAQASKHPTDDRMNFVNDYLKKLTKEAKQKMVEDHQVEYKDNPHDQIRHKNMMVALKNHLYKNPQLIGAEHTKTGQVSKTGDGTHHINSFLNRFKKDSTGLYKLMKEAGVAENDPRELAEDEEQKKQAAIVHMRNMMKLKKVLEHNPHLMKEWESETDVNPVPVRKPNGTKAQQGGNTINGVLKTMSREETYALMSRLGITDTDPRNDPDMVESGKDKIQHMRNVMALKKKIELDPSILNIPKEEKKLEDIKEENKEMTMSEKIKKFTAQCPKEVKDMMIEDFADHEIMENRNTSEDPRIDYMHSVVALRKIIEKDPTIMEDYQDSIKEEQQKSIKVANKKLGNFLRHIAGIKGVGDVFIISENEEWGFGKHDSSVLKTTDDEGNVVLSIMESNKDGEVSEYVYPIEDYQKFVDGQIKSAPKKEIPLHKQPMEKISSALEGDIEKLNAQVAKRIGREIHDSASAYIGLTGVSDIGETIGLSEKATIALFDKLGIEHVRDGSGGRELKSTYDNKFQELVFGHLVDGAKNKNAMDYVTMYGSNKTNWVLHESAKKWTDDEKYDARMDFVKNSISFDTVRKKDRNDDIDESLHQFTTESLEYVPFDLMTDVFTLSNIKVSIGDPTDPESPATGCFYDHRNRTVSLCKSYYSEKAKDLNTTADSLTGDKTGAYSLTVAHEFAHAIDMFLMGDAKQAKTQSGSWNLGNVGMDTHNIAPVLKKYSDGLGGLVKSSYIDAVKKHNPKAIVAMGGGSVQPYPYHVDNWIYSYQGRVYDNSFNTGPGGTLNITSDGLVDPQLENANHRGLGLEHFADSVMIYSQARMLYQNSGETDMGGFDAWHEDRSYPEDLTGDIDENPTDKKWETKALDNDEWHSWAWVQTKERHPDMEKVIKGLFHRGDFVEER